MKKQLLIEIDQDTFEKAQQILKTQYLNIDTAFEMFLNKIIEEKSILWLFKNETSTPAPNPKDIPLKSENRNFISPNYNENINGITKNLSIRLFASNGIKISKPTTFASKNKSAYNYWANPNWRETLYNDWYLILNDYISHKLYLFVVPKATFTEEDFVMRNDNPNLIDLQIAYNDPTFTDNRSQISFKEFLIHTISY